MSAQALILNFILKRYVKSVKSSPENSSYTDARKLRNEIVHIDQAFELYDEDLLFICNVAEFIQYALIWNLAMHSYPDMIDLFDSKWSIDHLERRYTYEEH